MKGTIEKINDNWMVILDQRTYQDPSAEDLILPLHIDDLWVIDHTGYILGEKQELNFHILTVEEGVTPCGTHIIYKDYAKLILKENHIVDTNEMVDKDIIDEAEKEFIKLLNGKALPTKQLTEVAEHYFIVGYEMATEKLVASSQTEISDEEIKKALHNAWCHYEYDDGNLYSTTFRDGWLMAIEWYREQLKQNK